METAEIFGYSVENKHNDAPGALAYILTGKRGATYGLMRTQKHPHLMFVVRGSNGTVCALQGNGWFTDADGFLTTRN